MAGAPHPYAAPAHEGPEPPFAIVVLGDFSGRGSAGPVSREEPDWRAIRVSPDNMPDLAGLAPRLALRLGDDAEGVLDREIEFEFASLDDFHPDGLFRRHPLFRELREARDRLGEDSGSEPASASVPADDDAGEGLLDDIVARTEPRVADTAETAEAAEAAALADGELREFVREIVGPHRVRPAPDRSAEIAAVDRAVGALMRGVLHHDRFRALESLWRSLVFLLSHIDSSGKVRVSIVNVSRDDLARDLGESSEPTASRLYDLLAGRSGRTGRERWAVAVGAYEFGPDAGDAALMDRIGQVARAADVPWISGADPALAGWRPHEGRIDPSSAGVTWPGDWAGLPVAPYARWLGLALPPCLVREPFGRESARTCRTFDFEEEPGGQVTDPHGAGEVGTRRLLWGHAGLLAAILMARAFARDGWAFSPTAPLDLSPVPLAPGSADDPMPVATEHGLAADAAARLAESGFMPVLAFPREARIRLAAVRPVSGNGGRLGAWWAR